jgi:hypothetical protein
VSALGKVTYLFLAGHMKMDPWYIKYAHSADHNVEAGTFPVLVSGTATIIQQEPSLYVRLNVRC